MINFLALTEQLKFDWNLGHRLAVIDALRQAAAMQDWLLDDATCPCCEEQIKCASDCTFAKDAPSDAERMAAVRAVLGSSP